MRWATEGVDFIESARDRAEEVFGPRLHEALGSDYGDMKLAVDATGIPYSTLRAYCKGERNPTMNNIVALCAFTGMSADWLLGLGETTWR